MYFIILGFILCLIPVTIATSIRLYRWEKELDREIEVTRKIYNIYTKFN